MVNIDRVLLTGQVKRFRVGYPLPYRLYVHVGSEQHKEHVLNENEVKDTFLGSFCFCFNAKRLEQHSEIEKR